MSGVVDSGREIGHGNIDANDPELTLGGPSLDHLVQSPASPDRVIELMCNDLLDQFPGV